MRTELVLDALDMAIAQRNPTTGLVHHSDHGCQRRFAYGRRLAASELVASMGTVGDALDNAVAEISSPPWNASSSTAIGGRPERAYGRRSSTSSRSSTTANAATRPLTTTHPPPTSSITHQQHLRPHTVSTETGQLQAGPPVLRVATNSPNCPLRAWTHARRPW
jgi:hypothetical protein